MMTNNLRFHLVAILIAIFAITFTACSQKNVPPPSVADTAEVEAAAPAPEIEPPMAVSEVIPEGMGAEESLESEPVVESPVTLEGRTSNGLYPVYFDFDQSSLRADQIARLEKNAKYMKDNPRVKVQIEGNCDERGTNEYNMALGERRSMSAKKYLENLGISSSRLNTISYGEERPINFGHDELSWSQNRRSDFVIK